MGRGGNVTLQLGFVSAILPDLSLNEVLTFARETGYDCVEVMCWPVGKAERRYAGVTHLDATDFGPAQAEEVRALVAESGVAISGLGYYPNPLAPDPDESESCVAHLRKVIKAAAVLGVRHMNTFIGRDWTKSVDDNWPRFLETWRPLIALADECNVKIGIENCPMIFTDDEWPGGKNLATSPAIWRRMFADIPSSNFGLNYDPSHMVWQHMDYLQPLIEFSARLYHLHAKDVRVDRERLNEVGIMATPNAWHTPKLPGLGNIEWRSFCSVLTKVGYDGPICVEVEDRDYEGSLDLRKRALQQSVAFMRKFIGRM